MNRFLGAIIDIVHLYCGDVVKFAGDAVISVFVMGGCRRRWWQQCGGFRMEWQHGAR